MLTRRRHFSEHRRERSEHSGPRAERAIRPATEPATSTAQPGSRLLMSNVLDAARMSTRIPTKTDKIR